MEKRTEQQQNAGLRFRNWAITSPSFEAVNEWYAGYAATVPAFAGSWLTFLYFGAAIWAIISLALRRFPFTLPKRTRPFIGACLAYTGAMLLADLVNGFYGLWESFTKVAAFAVVPFMVARYVNFDAKRTLRALCAYAPLGAMTGLALTLYQSQSSPDDVSGGAGNANVLGVVMAWLGLLSLAGLARVDRSAKLLAMAGFAAAMIGVILSHSRSIYPAILVLPLVFVVYSTQSTVRQRIWLVSGVGIFAVVLFLVLREQLKQDFDSAAADARLLELGDLGSSLGNRVALWRAALAALQEHPFLGFGPSEKMNAVVRHLPDQISYIRFSHIHNVFLDTAVASGIFGLIALIAVFVTPLWALRGNKSMVDEPDPRFIATSVLFISLLSGAVGALFVHDLLTVLYLMPMIIVLSINSGE